MKKTCRTCGNDFDDTPANFKPNQRTGGLSTQCRTCLRAQRRKASARKAERRQQQLARLEVGGIERLISAAASGGSSVPHTAELLEQIMQYFGGVSGFSALFVKQYFEAQAGGSFRTKMLDTVARLISKNTELGGAKKPLTLWSEEELESELNKRLEQVVMVYAGGIFNVEAQAPGIPVLEHTEVADSLDHGGVPAASVTGSADGTGKSPGGGVEAVRPDAGAE